ncbi:MULTISPECIES: MBL fold metallo-hydrolase [Synechocystis]|uniref:MBL fold metallo-hydrolase n=1 Tax=Synechocystis salina LEGE 00031 TaxID=1828736 RepID=A0ABR9VN59_9SYNC|nr:MULTISPECIES: MBL fold metallo-hydrolase [Synechocystis]MBD2653229.1 MBL fold metallo-hydrolase [Synechocystis sp. FACHB-383]MBE9196939.1 MBL fold metallo-hydrolase [Synechocystis sp. LEGE 06083]MBE9241284.1 MBL fold metallo-hydrolase [Synechocystis salina LEGE 00041]MBE9252772.1 MBL fold metallo-hydrolase [Synechocystis salina LEGE 00031]
MKRRKLIRTAGAGLLAVAGVQIGDRLRPATAQANSGLQVEWLGHSAFLFSANGFRILANPFRAIGCTKGFRLPRVQADLVLISSQLWDEGAAENLPGNPRILFEPGSYDIGGIQFQGISAPHDRLGGRRFGQNVVWRWSQGGIRVVHMGGAASPITEEQKILLGSPDLALIPVGGGPKNYDAAEAKAAMEVLNPRMVVPTQYATPAADRANCDLQTLQPFLDLVEGMNIQRINSNRLSLRANNLPAEGTLIRIFSEQGLLA